MKIRFLIPALLISISSSYAAGIGFINMQVALESYPGVKALGEEVRAMQQKNADAAQKEKAEGDLLRDDVRNSQQKQDREAFDAAIAKLRAYDERVRKADENSQTVMRTKVMSLRGQASEAIHKAAESVAKEKGLSQVFDSAAPFLVYTDGSSDITAEVVAIVKTAAPAPATAPPVAPAQD